MNIAVALSNRLISHSSESISLRPSGGSYAAFAISDCDGVAADSGSGSRMVGGIGAGSAEGSLICAFAGAGEAFAEDGLLVTLGEVLVKALPFPLDDAVVVDEVTGNIAGPDVSTEPNLSFDTCDVSSSATSSSDELGEGGRNSGAFFLGGETFDGAAGEAGCELILKCKLCLGKAISLQMGNDPLLVAFQFRKV